ncbi:MAG: carbamoyltransferase HypF [Archaeoglobaceae archaeon]|nr:carbamoyltransferase HypF [Archaeoglobaceae archaeon]MDW8013752.1 carbamoyltransferase HypF [Archaeoglobaceae archaeon]
MLKAIKLTVTGIVQGVGFRPFIYRTAVKSGVTGYVKNIGGSAVEIHVEGFEEKIKEFLKKFNENKLSLFQLDRVELIEVEPKNYCKFEIVESDPKLHANSMIPPDFSICDNCLREVLDVSSRFYLYPFHSCAYCGPRYSIIERIPYDRENTSMRDFPLCIKCISEYKDPENFYRFHAQGISCKECGPKVKLYTRDSEFLCEGYEAIEKAGKLIDEGSIVAVKGIGGYHIASLATRDEVVLRLRKMKRRPSKPFAVMALNLDVAARIVYLNDDAAKLLTSKERPIVLLDRREDSNVSDLVAPSLRQIGIFLPYTSIHYLLLNNTSDKFTIMTSGNPSGEPMCTDEECARKKLSQFVDYFLIHNRRIVNRVDDSVVRFTAGKLMLLRRGRGYAPKWTTLPIKLKKPVIAFGAMFQSSGAVGFEDKVVLTQYIGDLDEYNCFKDLEHYLKFLMNCYKISADSSAIVADLHPRYPSTLLAEEWARKYGSEILKVQHHWAHIASAMAEYGLEEEVVGIAIDGAGYGLDGTVWGGEVLIANYDDFERVGHLELHSMPGGDLAVKYPARMLASILSKELSEEEISKIFKKYGITEKGLPRKEKELEILLKHIHSSPKTSSIGRVLDSAATLLGICFERTYEGEPAIKLEAFSKKCNEMFEVNIIGSEKYVLKTTPIFLEALELLDKKDKREIAYMVQKSIGYGLGLIARKAAKKKHNYLVLSGGAAVNDYLVEGVEEAIGSKLKLLLPRNYPANDGGIALGQVAIAGHLLNRVENIE